MASGTNGSVAWRIDSSGTLHLGAGTPQVNTDNSTSPWFSYYSSIKKVSIEGKITLSTARAFFTGLRNVTEIDGLSRLDVSKVTDMNIMFSSCSSLRSIDLSSFSMFNVKNMGGMFQYCSSLRSIDLSSFHTYKATDMSSMFRECSSLTSLDLSSFSTYNVTNMSSMFSSCSSLRSLDLSSFSTLNVTRMTAIFHRTPIMELKLNLAVALTQDTYLNEPSGDSYTGKWQTIGTGTSTYPNGSWSGDTNDLINRSQQVVADTYVWQPVKSPAENVTVKYEDESGKTIHDPKTISGNVGDAYDASTSAYKLDIDNYTLDTSKLPSNATGKLTDTAQTVTYVYEKIQTMFKRVYWQNYGYVYEGAINNSALDMSHASNLEETIKIMDKEGKVVGTVHATPTNWYDSSKYNGFQFIIDNQILSGLKDGDYTFQIAITANGKQYSAPLNLGAETRSGAYHDTYSDLESTVVNTKVLAPTTANHQPGLSVTTSSDSKGGIIDKYWNDDSDLVFDAYVTLSDGASSNKLTKVLEITDKNGNKVYEKANLSMIETSWGDAIKIDPNTTFQAIVPHQFSNQKNYTYTVTTKDASGNTIGTQTLQ